MYISKNKSDDAAPMIDKINAVLIRCSLVGISKYYSNCVSKETKNDTCCYETAIISERINYYEKSCVSH